MWFTTIKERSISNYFYFRIRLTKLSFYHLPKGQDDFKLKDFCATGQPHPFVISPVWIWTSYRLGLHIPPSRTRHVSHRSKRCLEISLIWGFRTWNWSLTWFPHPSSISEILPISFFFYFFNDVMLGPNKNWSVVTDISKPNIEL